MNPRLLIAAAMLASGALGAPALTTVRDILYKADGTRFNGVLTISWNSFIAADNTSVVQQSSNIKITDGNLKIQLVPSTTGTPAIFYKVIYSSDGRVQFQETWSVPSSAQPLMVRDVRIAGATSGGGGGGGTTPPPGQVGTIEENDVIGLIADLEARPLKGPGFAPNRVAMVNSLGAIESVLGTDSDCVHVDGSTGPCGMVAPAFIDNETPAGIVDGSNVLFTLAATPAPVASLAVYRNGLLQKIDVDYTISSRNITFVAGAVPQPGDILLASYRLAVSEDGTAQLYPAAQVLCGAVGGTTGNIVMTSLGACFIPPGVLVAGDRVEIRFNYEHVGSSSGFTTDIRWGGSAFLTRSGAATDTLLTGHGDAGVYVTGAQLSAQSWGTASLPFTVDVSNAFDPYAGGLIVDFRGMLAQSGADVLTLRNFTVIRLP
jgi:hypothetical protein